MHTTRALASVVTIYLLYSAALAIGSHSGFPRDLRSGLRFPYLADKPVGEDAYYMLTVAWNIASGRGLVYNYDLPTTGIQPLATVIYATLAWIVQFFGGDKWFLIRSLVLFGSLSLLLLAQILATIARDLAESRAKELAYTLGFIGVLFNFTLFRWFTYGLETGVYLVFFALCIKYSRRLNPPRRPTTTEALLFGLLGGATAWARIDFGVSFAVFLLVSLSRRHVSLPWAGLAAGVATLTIIPWLVYVLATTGRWLPSSASAQAALVTVHDAPLRLWMMAQVMLGHLTPWMYVYFNINPVFLLGGLLSLVAFAGFLFRDRSVATFLRSTLRRQVHLTTWLIGAMVLTLLYGVFFWATHFYQRYSAPLILPVTAMMAAAVAERTRAASRATQLIILALLPACFFTWAFARLHTGRIGNPLSVMAGVVRSHFASAKVGSYQSGVIGYFNPNVINLDGKVNHAALDYAKARRLHLYVDAEDIDVLVDWDGYIYWALDAEWLASNWAQCDVRVPTGGVCLQRKARP